MALQIGDKIKNIKLPSTGDKTLSMHELEGKQVVFYFYPKDATPGCTQQGCDFRDRYHEFQKANTVVFGISRDSIASHEKFKAKKAFPFELVSDTEEKLCNLFDVIKMKQRYGKQVRGIERSTFLLDKKGSLIKEWRDVKVNGHVDDVLTAAQTAEKESGSL